MKIIAPVRGWRWAARKDRLRARARPPGQAAPRRGPTRSTTTCGAALGGRADRGHRGAACTTTCSTVTQSEERRRAAGLRVGDRAGLPGVARRRAARLVELLERAGGSAPASASGTWTHIEDRIVGLKVRDLYEVPAAAMILPAQRELERAGGTINQNNFKPDAPTATGRSCVRRPAGTNRCWRTSARSWTGQRAGDGRGHDAPLQGQRSAGLASLAQRALRPCAGRLRRVGRAVLQQASPGFVELYVLPVHEYAYNVRKRGKGTS